jgi:hypothetical protein
MGVQRQLRRIDCPELEDSRWLEMLANPDIIVGAALNHNRSKPMACEIYGCG